MERDVVAVLKSADIDATTSWYRRVGFTIRREEPALCEVARDGLALQFLSGETPWAAPSTLTGCFYVHVADVQVVADDVRGVVEARWGIEDREWGSRELVLEDPDGYFITFTAPLGEDLPVAHSDAPARTSHDRCWCCDEEFDDTALLRLGAHPDAVVCLDCARSLRRRALARQDLGQRSLRQAVRRRVQRVRTWVVERGWQRRGLLGSALRRLDRYLP